MGKNESLVTRLKCERSVLYANLMDTVTHFAVVQFEVCGVGFFSSCCVGFKKEWERCGRGVKICSPCYKAFGFVENNGWGP